MLIAIDHGNEQIKTQNHIFTSGLDMRNKRPPMAKSLMEYNGNYYSLTEDRLKYRWDKTTDESYFALTLFAIAKELSQNMGQMHYGVQDVQLAVGLPPAHYSALYERFEKYFYDREPVVKFVVDGTSYTIRITDVMAFPQGYAAAITVFPRLENKQTICVVEIGGITTDYLLLKNKAPDLGSTDSLEFGMIKLYKKITSQVQGNYGMCIDKDLIDSILLNTENLAVRLEIVDIVRNCAVAHLRELILELRERGIDLRTTKALFAGGGSIALKPYIEEFALINNPIVIEDIHANAHGFDLLYRMSK